MIVKDPVCGRILESDDAAGQSEYAGDTYYFCSPGCKEEFDETLLEGGEEAGKWHTIASGIAASFNALASLV